MRIMSQLRLKIRGDVNPGPVFEPLIHHNLLPTCTVSLFILTCSSDPGTASSFRSDELRGLEKT